MLKLETYSSLSIVSICFYIKFPIPNRNRQIEIEKMSQNRIQKTSLQ